MGTSLKVLFVEDSELDTELTIAELERGGFSAESHQVQTYDEMNTALKNQEWDVIICDYRMPQFSAEEALQTLQKSGLDLPFIITSGAVTAADAVTLLKQGAHDFMDKSSLARLVPAIEREIREAEVRRKKREVEQRVRMLSLAVEQSPVSVVITDSKGTIIYVNPRFEDSLGYSSEEATGRHLGFTFKDDESVKSLQSLWQSPTRLREWRGEFASTTKSGQAIWEYINVSPLTDELGQLSHYIVVKEDITVRRSYEEQLLHQAHYDDLTGLANRVLLMDRLSLALENANRQDTKVALLGIDLDNFKNVNDSLGHSIGDNLLKEAAERLSRCVRGGDTLARMGGDEFVVIIPELKDPRDAQKVAEKILYQFSTPFVIFGRDYFVTTSVGIALYPDDGTNPHLLLRNADLAMYKAKDQGRNGYYFFTEDINTRLLDRLELEANLRYVIVRNQLYLHYQPIFDLQTRQIVGLEALVRWRQRENLLRMPNEFIPLAEEIGIICDIDSWVLATACRQLPDIARANGPRLRLALNISAKQLEMPQYADFVQEQLELNHLQPDQLELEITERVLVTDTPTSEENLKKLCDMGVHLSIDDFGTGYSSLGYLQKYPFKTLKVDRSFVSNIAAHDNAKRLVETIVKMGQGLGMDIVAEGIETEAEETFLREIGCERAQGYRLGRPAPFNMIKGLLQKAYPETE